MMRYMFLIYSQERTEPLKPEEAQTLMDTHWALMQDTRQKGILLGVDALKPTNTATTVRINGAQSLITDGPFAETKEQLAGYYMLECKDLDEAIEWAKRIPTGCKGAQGCIEIRPIHELSRRP
jgi:hypothetical protein